MQAGHLHVREALDGQRMHVAGKAVDATDRQLPSRANRGPHVSEQLTEARTGKSLPRAGLAEAGAAAAGKVIAPPAKAHANRAIAANPQTNIGHPPMATTRQ